MAYGDFADGVDRRQPRQPADDEVSGRVHDGAGRSRRDSVDRVRLEGPASGRRREGGALCSAHVRAGSSRKSISKNGGRASYRGLVQGARTAPTSSKTQRRLRRADSRSARAAATRIRTSKSKSRTCKSSHEASVSRIGEEQLFYLQSRGLTRGRSQHDDRQRLHRAAGERAADGIRRRNEPADRAADGRQRGLVRCRRKVSIAMSIATDPTTEQLIAELYKIDGKAEIVGGRIVMMSPTGECRAVRRFAIVVQSARICEGTWWPRYTRTTLLFLVNLPNRKSFCPDAAITRARARDEVFAARRRCLRSKFAAKAIMAVRPSARWRQKRADYFAAGTKVVWDVDLLERRSGASISRRFAGAADDLSSRRNCRSGAGRAGLEVCCR